MVDEGEFSGGEIEAVEVDAVGAGFGELGDENPFGGGDGHIVSFPGIGRRRRGRRSSRREESIVMLPNACGTLASILPFPIQQPVLDGSPTCENGLSPERIDIRNGAARDFSDFVVARLEAHFFHGLFHHGLAGVIGFAVISLISAFAHGGVGGGGGGTERTL